jgi:hypothetical protein
MKKIICLLALLSAYLAWPEQAQARNFAVLQVRAVRVVAVRQRVIVRPVVAVRQVVVQQVVAVPVVQIVEPVRSYAVIAAPVFAAQYAQPLSLGYAAPVPLHSCEAAVAAVRAEMRAEMAQLRASLQAPPPVAK